MDKLGKCDRYSDIDCGGWVNEKVFNFDSYSGTGMDGINVGIRYLSVAHQCYQL